LPIHSNIKDQQQNIGSVERVFAILRLRDNKKERERIKLKR